MPAGAFGVFRDHPLGDWVKAGKSMRELPVVERARALGVLCTPWHATRVRCVLHLDVDDVAVARAGELLAEALRG